MASFKIGADPELFLKKWSDRLNKWYYVSAETSDGPLIPGTKKDPYKVRKGAIQVDGVAAEFNIDPAKDMGEFINNISTVVRELKVRLDPKQIKLDPVPTATFRKKYFEELPDKVKELGCEPDFNANKDGQANPRPTTDKPFRTGSGHIHLGWYSPQNFVDPHYTGHIKDCCLVVKELDKYLLFASKDWDKDETRRSLYGAPGSFRPKPFGVEYRPLSNAWLKTPETVQTVYMIALGVIRGIDSGKFHIEREPLTPVKDQSNTKIALRHLSQYLPEYF